MAIDGILCSIYLCGNTRLLSFRPKKVTFWKLSIFFSLGISSGSDDGELAASLQRTMLKLSTMVDVQYTHGAVVSRYAVFEWGGIEVEWFALPDGSVYLTPP